MHAWQNSWLRVMTVARSAPLTNTLVLLLAGLQLQALLTGRQTLPPLFCIPLLVKDNYDTVGMASTAGASTSQHSHFRVTFVSTQAQSLGPTQLGRGRQ
jgi:Asp-tRNA(Asn)/Glu-tRNA(Gln) amidotransferase A subunit family amidase